MALPALGAAGFPLPEIAAPVPLSLYFLSRYFKKKADEKRQKVPFKVKEKKSRDSECIFYYKGRWVSPFIKLGTTEDGQEVLIPFRDLTRHVLLLGTTGAGKTTTIRKLLHSVMMFGGGATFVDGKADVTDTYEVFCRIVEECDRRDDFFTINFLNPLQSNTINPLLYGDSEFLTELIAVFLTSSGFWAQKGLALMRGLMAVHVWMRDHDENGNYKPLCRPFTFWDIKKYLNLDALIDLAKQVKEGKIPARDETGMPIGDRLIGFLADQGPWEELLKPADKIDYMAVEQVIKQTGFAIQQWTAALDLLGGAFAPIFCTKNPDIDMRDVIQNGRILYVLLPSLGKSETTLQQLGKLILGIIKTSLDEMLGKETVGLAEDVETKTRRVRPPLPHICILDEYGSYAVEGFSTVLAQARSLNYAVVISAQELGRMMKDKLKAEGEALIANTNIKLIMKIEDANTAQTIVQRAGKEWRFTPSALKRESVPGFGYMRAEGWQVQERDRLRPNDLTKLKPGELYLIYEDNVIKMRVPYEKGKPIKEFSVLKPVKLEEFGRWRNRKVRGFGRRSLDLEKLAQESVRAIWERLSAGENGGSFKVSFPVFLALARRFGSNFAVKILSGHGLTGAERRVAESYVREKITKLSPCLGKEHLFKETAFARKLLAEAEKALTLLEDLEDLKAKVV